MTIAEVYTDISKITQKVIENGLSVHEKWPHRQGTKVVWRGQQDVSIALKNIPYVDKYKTLSDDGNYNFKMIDGGLLQFMYEFDKTGRNLQSHRLCFFPSPFVGRYDDDPMQYEDFFSVNSEFYDMIEKNTVTFPVRFDYNVSPSLFKAIEHPFSHVSFGEFEFCRIPVSCPITPTIFFNFILRNFYNYIIRTYGDIVPVSEDRFNPCIDTGEKSILHFNISNHEHS